LSAVPEPLSADVIEARDAACEARPRLHPVPAYPAHSGASLGDVHVDATVDTSGQIEVPIRVLFATDSVFAAQAVTALKSWRFAPALLMLGKPVRQRIHVQVHFDPNALARDQVKNLLIAAGDHGAGILVIARRPEASQTRMSSAMR
jgi:TonB family protein